MLNRSAVILRYKQPFVDWINSADPYPKNKVTLAEVNEENNIYLIEIEDQGELEKWLGLNYEILFEKELHGWYTDTALWPQDRSLALLKTWCSFELHTMVFDTGRSPLENDET
jgi:hypothetical protein